MAPCASRSNAKAPERFTNRKFEIEPLRWIRNSTSARSDTFPPLGRCQRLWIWATMLRRYSGYGNCTPSVLTVAGSVPVDGSTSGASSCSGLVRGAGSFSISGSGVGGGGVSATDVRRGRRDSSGAGRSAGRSTTSGARLRSGSGRGAATSSTRYTGGATRRTSAGADHSPPTAAACSATVATSAIPVPRASGALRRALCLARFTARLPPIRQRAPRRRLPTHASRPAPAPPARTQHGYLL